MVRRTRQVGQAQRESVCSVGTSPAVSFTVSFSRHSVDLRVHCYDTDAKDLA